MAVRFDAAGDLALVGTKAGMWNVNGGWNTNVGLFVQTYTVAGNAAPVVKWFHCSGSGAAYQGASAGVGVAFDGLGHVLATGNLSFGTVDFGGTSVTTTPNSHWGFVTQYSL
jgi:hypothetical protein